MLPVEQSVAETGLTFFVSFVTLFSHTKLKKKSAQFNYGITHSHTHYSKFSDLHLKHTNKIMPQSQARVT